MGNTVKDKIKADKNKFNIMYKGDKDRDAKSTIRGFLFQDFVAIDYLTDTSTVCLCSEFLEDINVFDTAGNIKMVQVKYYPSTSPKMDVISTDLYYQYLRMELLACGLKCKPVLYIARNAMPQMKDLEQMKKLAGDFNAPRLTLDPDKVPQWLEDNVNDKGKEAQKKVLFENLSSNTRLEEFVKIFEIIKVAPDIKSFQEQVAKKLNAIISGGTWGKEHKENILIGLAVTYIQKRYFKDESELDKAIIDREEFIKYLSEQIYETNEASISAYVLGKVRSIYAGILKRNENLDEAKADKLQMIVYNTEKWLIPLVGSIEGQYQLLNTISLDNREEMQKFRELDVEARLIKIAEEKNGLENFLCYIWKIILDMNISNGLDEKALNVENYIDSSVTEYICVKFNKDVVPGIILSNIPSGRAIDCFESIYNRLYFEKKKPVKLYMEGPFRGRYEYKKDITDVCEKRSITNPIKEDCYMIECMECIGIDKGGWNKIENCEECIFKQECIAEGK